MTIADELKSITDSKVLISLEEYADCIRFMTKLEMITDLVEKSGCLYDETLRILLGLDARRDADE